MRLNTLWDLIDTLDQASSEISCWFFLFFPQPSACSSYLFPLKFQIVTVVGDFWLRLLLSPFTYKISTTRPGSLHSSDHIFSQQGWAQECIPRALACLWRSFLLLFVLTFLEEPESFPCPPPEVSLSHEVVLWLWCEDNHQKQTAGLIHHKSGVMWVYWQEKPGQSCKN